MKSNIIKGFILMSVVIFIFLMDIPNWKKLEISKITEGDTTSVITDLDGREVMFLSGGGNRIRLNENEIPENVKRAFVATEDTRFYSHIGVDIKRIFGALLKNIKSAGIKEGASTITQQLIKLTHLSGEKTISRKTNEAYLAIRLERKMSKDEILAHYINTVYFGQGAYGIESASRAYFSKSAKELTLSETALLAGLVKAPTSYNPVLNLNRAVERRNYVLKSMHKEKMITEEELEKALSEEIKLSLDETKEKYMWYRDYVIDEAIEITKLSADELLSGGYRIKTCIDPDRQARAEALFENNKLFPPDASDGTKAQAAVAVLNSETGGIYAIIGGREYEVKRGLNRAADAMRQPGSVIKPISVYAAAVDSMGLSPSYILDDSKKTFEGGYSPKNAGDQYNGLVTMREALSRSMNVASVSLMEFVGVDKTREYLKRFAIPITKQDNGLSLALGSVTKGVSPLQIANAYASLSNGGMKTNAHAIEEIRDRNGKIIYSYTPKVTRIMTKEGAYMITSMLETAAKSGSAKAFANLNSIAAKTGTVSIDEMSNRDIWTAAYNTNVSACVWMGFDITDGQHALSASSSGSSYPAKLLSEFFKDEKAEPFEKPDGIISVKIDKQALKTQYKALLAPDNAPKEMTMSEIFRKGSEPKHVSDSFIAPPRPDAPDIIERDGEIFVRFAIENENYEYLVLKETNGIKEIVKSVSGARGEKAEIALEMGEEDFLVTLIARNRLMLKYGISLLSEESEGVWVNGKSGFMRKVEKIFDFGS